MYSIKSRLVTCPFLWHLKFKPAVTQHSSWLQFISTSQQNAESASAIDSDTFGNLVTAEGDHNVKKKILHRKYRSCNTFQRIPYDDNGNKPNDNSSHSSSLTLENSSYNNVLEKWQKMKEAEHGRILRHSRTLRQDDSEEEYYMFRNESLTDVVEKSMRSSEESSKDKQESELQSIETFGLLQPFKNEYEFTTGDEGDAREEKFQAAQTEKRYPPQYYGKKMRELCKEKKLSEALKILEEDMPAVGAKPDDYCYQVLIGACGREGYTKKAFQLYNQMKKRGLIPKHVAYTGLFNACANSPWPLTDGITRANRLRQQLIETGVILNSKTSHAMIKAFGRCGDMRTAFQIVDEMVDKGLMVTTESLNFLLQACITNHEAGFRHALLVWRKIRELNLTPDIYSYNLLVRCINECKAGEPQLSALLLQEMLPSPQTKKAWHEPKLEGKHTEKVLHIEAREDSGNTVYKPVVEHETPGNKDATTVITEPKYTIVEVVRNDEKYKKTMEALPEVLGKNISLGRVVELTSLDQPEDRLALLGGPVGIFKHMKIDKVKADLRTVTQMLDSLPADTQAEEALLESMKNMEIVPDSQFCNKLIRKRSFRGDINAAKEVLDIMQEHHLTPNLITFGCVALGCHSLYDARSFLKDMDNLSFRPNLEIMTALVKNSLVRTDYYFTVEMLYEMRDRNISPDKHLINVLEKARKRARDIILKSETDSSSQLHMKTLEGIKLFLMEYKNWLKGSNMNLPDHPWAQYRTASTNLR